MSTPFPGLAGAYGVTGPFEQWVRKSGDCLLWEGNTRPSGPHWGKQSLHARAAELAGLPVMYGNRYYTVCEKPLCISPAHIVHPTSELGRMLFIKENSSPEEDCLIWTGDVNRNGHPSMKLGKSNKSVRRFVYRVEWDYPEDWTTGVIETSCKKVLCVEATHLYLKEEVVKDEFDLDGLEYEPV